MKNINVLPVDKPSMLFEIDGHLIIDRNQLITPKSYRNIYITSEEKPKNGDWVLHHGNPIFKFDESMREFLCDDCKKIILTTDVELIADDVQSIDDKFLEWFVKNPSCEWIEWEYKSNEFIQKELGTLGHDQGLSESEYKDYIKEYGAYQLIIPKEEPKQETLEEALTRHYPIHHLLKDSIEYNASIAEKKISFLEGVQWYEKNSDKKYSEEDMLMFANLYCSYTLSKSHLNYFNTLPKFKKK